MSEDMPALAAAGAVLVVRRRSRTTAARSAAEVHGVPVHLVGRDACEGFPPIDPGPPPVDMPRVVVTGCYDWLHSGHIRFFMDAAAYGALYVVVGSDRNVELLKGPGHPLQREEERRYMVGSVRSVYRGMISSGSGWMDAEPEIAAIRPTHYVVNEDGDQPEKREFCRIARDPVRRAEAASAARAAGPLEHRPARVLTKLWTPGRHLASVTNARCS